MPTTLFTSLYGFKAWSDAEMLNTLEALPAERADMVKSCLRIFNHISMVDQIFRAHLLGAPRPFDATNTEQVPPLAELRRTMGDTNAWYMDHVADLAPAALRDEFRFVFTDGDRGRMTREEILFHVVCHGVYHRGNVGQILMQHALAPPRDVYARFLHQGEPARREF
jgi:uncharacterized damage-inducible protein DinB